MRNIKTKKLFHGEVLFKAGQTAEHFFLVRQGRVSVVDQAGIATGRNFGVDELFGIPEVLASGTWGLSALASGMTEVQVFPACSLFDEMAKMPETHYGFICKVASMA